MFLSSKKGSQSQRREENVTCTAKVLDLFSAPNALVVSVVCKEANIYSVTSSCWTEISGRYCDAKEGSQVRKIDQSKPPASLRKKKQTLFIALMTTMQRAEMASKQALTE